LNLKLVGTARLRKESRRKQGIVEIGRRRRRRLTSGKRERAADKDSQFPHRGLSHFEIIP
jgi:hypothetical protein